MAQNFKVPVTFERISGIPADQVVNDFYFHWANATAAVAADWDVVVAALQQFYDTVPAAGTRAVGSYLGEQLRRDSKAHARFYEIPAVRGHLGPPVYDKKFDFADAGSGTPLPEECAIVLSYESDVVGLSEFGAAHTRPRARHRGRIYLGPLEGTLIALEDGATHEVTVGSTCRTDIVAAAVQSFSAGAVSSPLHGTDWTWGQFSPTNWLRQLVQKCWVDDAFDIQRRRGAKASLRTTGTIL